MSEKQLALVTGGSRGIGASICKRLARDGFHVYVNFSSSEGKAKEVVESIQSAGGSAETIGFSVGESSTVSEVFEKIKKDKGPLKVLVNNAGIAADGLLIRMKDEDLIKTLDIDLKGAIFCAREAAKQMMKARAGSIIQISSVIGEMGNAGQAAYSAAKAGLNGFTKSAARELAGRGIRVNAITPGFIATDMTEALTEPQKEAILRTIPLGQIGSPDDVASLVAFLASDESRYITGQIIGINGGLYM